MNDATPPASREASDPAPEASSAPQVPPPPALAPQEHFRVLESIKDNIEAFTIALVMALVIKHFCVEAFKIPTGSMEPTLLGEKNHGVGDRILVDKLAYVGGGPERWDVIVFRFPLNKSKHFIKRVAGVGGEFLRILHGDIWVRDREDAPWHIATKPRSVRQELYRPVFPVKTQAETELADYWNAGEGWDVESLGELRYEGGEESTLDLLKKIGAESSAGWEDPFAAGPHTRDVRFRLSVVPEGPGRLVLRWKSSETDEIFVRLASEDDPEGSVAGLRRPGLSANEALDVVWEAGRRIDLELECVDGQVHVHEGERLLATLDEHRSIDGLRDFDDYTQDFEIVAEGAPIAVHDFRIDRDIYYERSSDLDVLEDGDRGMWIPEDKYFVLGDNTTSSHDSRKWTLTVAPLEDGREILYYTDRDNRLRYEDGENVVVDSDGIERHWRSEDVITARRESRRAPFVPRKLVVGRAFLVFWPVTPDFPGRLGFIR